jgi:putative oxidoreductase
MIPERFAPQVYTLFRMVFGFLFMFHGLQKLFGMFGGRVMIGVPLMATAGVIETFGGLLIMLGLATRVAAFIAAGEMAVAYFMQHQPGGTWPIQNRGELAVLYCFAFLYIATRGAGSWSVDRLRGVRTR